VPVVLDATVGGASANSYITVADADAYVETFLLSETNREVWADQETDDKSRLLIQATRQLDWYFKWVGERTDDEQALGWPRYYAYREDLQLPDNEIPYEIKHGTVEMALWLLEQQDEIPVDGNYLLNDVAVGPIRVNFNEKSGGQAKIYMPDKVAAIVQRYGTAEAPQVPMAGQAKSIRLERA
jgi:hypothetical protein